MASDWPGLSGVEDAQRRLIADAEERARDAARIEAHLDSHDRQLGSVNRTVGTNTDELRALRTDLADLRADFRQSVAVQEARAKDAERAASQQVTSRQLYIAAAAIAISIISPLAASGAFG